MSLSCENVTSVWLEGWSMLLLTLSASAANFRRLLFFSYNKQISCHRDLLWLPIRSWLVNVISASFWFRLSDVALVNWNGICKSPPFVSLGTLGHEKRYGHLRRVELQGVRKYSKIALSVSVRSMTLVRVQSRGKKTGVKKNFGKTWDCRVKFLCRRLWIWSVFYLNELLQNRPRVYFRSQWKRTMRWARSF